jgi:hypothetical protein
MKNKYLAFLLVCLVVAITVSAGIARDSGSKGMTEKELAQLAVDIHEINNLMSLHAWYHAASMNDVELNEIWSKKDDIVWAQNSGYWIGPKAIKEYYGKTVSRESTKGQFVWHTITTPVVEVARDRKTAKGVWYTPGVVGGFDMGSFNWMFEKYGVDFVREDGVWKVWHMHVYTDAAWPLNGTITAGSGGGPGGPPAGGAPGAGAAGARAGAPPAGAPAGAPGGGRQGETIGAEASAAPPGMGAGPTKSKQNYKEVSPTTEEKLVPRPPVPYNTWSETWSYVDDGE